MVLLNLKHLAMLRLEVHKVMLDDEKGTVTDDKLKLESYGQVIDISSRHIQTA